ncbi:90_t:CDS:2, partial [Dentiscutata erythropus]
MSVMSTADATPTNTTDLFNSHSSSKGKEKEDTTTYIVSQQSQGESDSYTKEDKLKKASGMLFGKQQDVTVVVAEGRDLYDGLDVYFDASTRVQFDRSTSNIYKSNAYLRFEKAIYLDRYLDKNREILRNLIKEANEWRKEIDTLQEELKDFSRDKTTFLSTVDLLKSSAEFVQSLKNEDFIMDENFGRELEEESDWVVKKIN